MTDQAASRFVVHHGDNMAILPTLADCSVDAIELARHRIGLAARNGWQAGLELEAAA